MKNYTKITQEELDAREAAIVRDKRNQLLFFDVDPIVSNPLRWADLTTEKQDAWKNFATRQTAVEGILGFMGGGGNVSLTNAYTYKERKKELDDAIKEMDLQDEIVKSKGGIGMLDFVSSHSLFKNQLGV